MKKILLWLSICSCIFANTYYVDYNSVTQECTKKIELEDGEELPTLANGVTRVQVTKSQFAKLLGNDWLYQWDLFLIKNSIEIYEGDL